MSGSVYDALKEMILERRLAPGMRINISEMARQLHVSATPVREALARLEADALVTKEHLRGYSVTAPLDSEHFDQLYEIRLILEPTAARLAAVRRSQEQLRAMEETVAKMTRATAGRSFRMVNTYASQDALFHALIAEASGNVYIQDTIARLRSHQQLARLYFHHGILDADEAIPEHAHILDAIRHRDAELAADLLTRHIERGRLRLAEIREAVATDQAEAI